MIVSFRACCSGRQGAGRPDASPSGGRLRGRANRPRSVEENIMKKLMLGLGLAVAALAGATGVTHAEGERFVFVSHAPDSDSWWNTIKNAITVASEQMGVTVDYRNPPTGDLADMARIIQQASASSPNGIVTTIADYNALSGPITDAVAKGIPVITVNSGTIEQSKELGALLHIGQPEYDAGKGAGEIGRAHV